MKITIYINKKEFDEFFNWMNRLEEGILQPPPVAYSSEKEDIRSPLEIGLTPDEWILIQDIELNLSAIQRTFGGIEILYDAEPHETDKLLIADILRNAARYDLGPEVVKTAFEIIQQIPSLSPVEAMIISEQEWIYAEKIDNLSDI